MATTIAELKERAAEDPHAELRVIDAHPDCGHIHIIRLNTGRDIGPQIVYGNTDPDLVDWFLVGYLGKFKLSQPTDPEAESLKASS